MAHDRVTLSVWDLLQEVDDGTLPADAEPRLDPCTGEITLDPPEPGEDWDGEPLFEFDDTPSIDDLTDDDIPF